MMWKELLIRFLLWTAVPMEKPALFSSFHILASSLCLFAIPLAKHCSTFEEKKRIRILFVCGILLAISELYKQAFLYFIVQHEVYNWWWFPFQLCSVPMYLCLLLPVLKGKPQDAVLTFLWSFTALGALCALAFPQDMLREYVTLTLHAFFWHAVLLFIAFLIFFSKMAGRSWQSYGRAVMVFLVCAGIAEIFNVISHTAPPELWADLFYISPWYLSQQPVFHAFAVKFGIAAGNVFYILMILTACALLHALYRVYSK